MILLLSAALAAVPDCPPPAAPQVPVLVGLDAHGRKVAGLGIVTFEQERWSLTLLSPGGLEMFTVAGPPATVSTAFEAWIPWLERLPVERDLRLAFTPTDTTCRSGAGKVHVSPKGRRWCGAGGPATLTEVDGSLVLADRRRGYTLTLRVTGAPG